MKHNYNLEETVLGDYMMGHGKYMPDQQKRKEQLLEKARGLKSLEIFAPNKIPDQAYELWNKMSAGGKRFSKFAKPGDTPKVIFNRFLSKKRDEYVKRRQEFKNLYGHDYKELDFEGTSNAADPVWTMGV